MSRSFNGSSDFLVSSINVDLSAVKIFSVSFWLNWGDNTGTIRSAVQQGSNSGVDSSCLIAPQDSFVGNKFIVYNQGNAGANIPAYPQISTGSYHHICCIYDRNQPVNQGTLFVDASVITGNMIQQDVNTNNFTDDLLFFMCSSTAGVQSLFGQGLMAEFSIFPGVRLSTDEINILFMGVSPYLVKPGVHPWYWPLIGVTSPETEYSYAANATVNGATQSPHIRVYYPE